MHKKELYKIYEKLLKIYGFQGWWPIHDFLSIDGRDAAFYHPQDYSYPKNEEQKFEIICGAILTQNANWQNVAKSVHEIAKLTQFDAAKFLKLDDEIIKNTIKSSGYFNQKTKKLKLITEFFINLKSKTPTREQLLQIWGIGPETADSILLYAYKQPGFLIDAYTKRVFTDFGFFNENAKYDEMKKFFEDNLEKDYKFFQEFHALIVEHAKNTRIKTNKKQ